MCRQARGLCRSLGAPVISIREVVSGSTRGQRTQADGRGRARSERSGGRRVVPPSEGDEARREGWQAVIACG